MATITKRFKKIILPQWQEVKDLYSLGYVSSDGNESNIQFSVTLIEDDFWLWEIYRIDLERVVRMGKLKNRKIAEEVTLFWAAEEANYRRKELRQKGMS